MVIPPRISVRVENIDFKGSTPRCLQLTEIAFPSTLSPSDLVEENKTLKEVLQISKSDVSKKSVAVLIRSAIKEHHIQNPMKCPPDPAVLDGLYMVMPDLLNHFLQVFFKHLNNQQLPS